MGALGCHAVRRPDLPAHTMSDFASLSSAKRLVLGAGDKPPPALGRFELLRELGRGVQTSVWLAFDPRLQRQVAIKLLRPVQGPDAAVLDQWLREARHVAALTHPFIVPVLEVDVQGLQPYIVFEYVPGPWQNTWRSRDGALPTRPWR